LPVINANPFDSLATRNWPLTTFFLATSVCSAELGGGERTGTPVLWGGGPLAKGQTALPLHLGHFPPQEDWHCPFPRSQALAGNAIFARLCLANGRNGRQRLPNRAFPGRAWERGVIRIGYSLKILRKGLCPLKFLGVQKAQFQAQL
jgi:hypothetical protein